MNHLSLTYCRGAGSGQESRLFTPLSPPSHSCNFQPAVVVMNAVDQEFVLRRDDNPVANAFVNDGASAAFLGRNLQDARSLVSKVQR